MKALVFADIVHLDDVRMVQLAGALGFAPESLDVARLGREALGQHLERHDALHLDLARLEDRAHAAAVDARQQFVASEAGRDLLVVRCGRFA